MGIIFAFFAFLFSLSRGIILICLGILIRSHLHTLFNFISRRPLPENLISQQDYIKMAKIINIIGICLIIMGFLNIIFIFKGLA